MAGQKAMPTASNWARPRANKRVKMKAMPTASNWARPRANKRVKMMV
jgi:hypothetical protein